MCSGTTPTEVPVLCYFLCTITGCRRVTFAAHLLPHATGFREKYQEHNLPPLRLTAAGIEQERLTSRILFGWCWKGQVAGLD